MNNETTSASDTAQRWREFDKRFAETYKSLPVADQITILHVAARNKKRMPGTYRRICESLKAG